MKKSQRINIRMTDEMLSVLKERCESQGISMTEYIERLIEKDVSTAQSATVCWDDITLD